MSVFTLLVLLIWDFSQRSLIYASHKPFATCRRLLRVCLHNKFHVAFFLFLYFWQCAAKRESHVYFGRWNQRGLPGCKSSCKSCSRCITHRQTKISSMELVGSSRRSNPSARWRLADGEISQ